jgi:hypothetical protein
MMRRWRVIFGKAVRERVGAGDGGFGGRCRVMEDG